MCSSNLKIFNSHFNGKVDPSQKFTKSYWVLVNLFLCNIGEVVLDKLKLLIFFIVLFLWSEWPVLTHSDEKFVVVEESFRFFPFELVSVSFTKEWSILELEDVEQSLEDSLEFDDIEMPKVSDLFFPLLWHKWGIDSLATSHRFIVSDTAVFVWSHSTLSSVTSSWLELFFLHSIHLSFMLSSLIWCIESR